MVEIGNHYKFNYPEEFTTLPEYSNHRGQTVKVLRKLTDEEADREEEPMFKIQASDGWEGDAFESELIEI